MLGLVALPSFFALAQKQNTRPQPCGTNEVMEQEFQKHPELRQQFQYQQKHSLATCREKDYPGSIPCCA
jgi:hypothetical protein